jgi:uncharacterized protein involved in type VI secretion and phage assembly
MANGLIETLADQEPAARHSGFAVAPGIVTESFDLLGEGRVKVRIPAAPGFEPWARIASVGAGSGRGFAWIPQIDDEVLVAFAQDDAASAYILGGLWSTRDRPPLDLPTDSQTKRVIKTGVASAPGHTVEFDDLLQSVTITTSTKQKITMSPEKLELSAAFGAMTISMSTPGTISIQSALKLQLKATDIAIEGVNVEIKGATITIDSEGPCMVKGLPIQLN